MPSSTSRMTKKTQTSAARQDKIVQKKKKRSAVVASPLTRFLLLLSLGLSLLKRLYLLELCTFVITAIRAHMMGFFSFTALRTVRKGHGVSFIVRSPFSATFL